jgi:hypothetical protein
MAKMEMNPFEEKQAGGSNASGRRRRMTNMHEDVHFLFF